MKRNKPVDLHMCLFNAFCGDHDAQAPEQLWAIYEGFERIHPVGWEKHCARKEHQCMRGCAIKPRDIYFSNSTGGAWGSEWKFCAGCAAMLLYFREVDRLPHVYDTHWDREAKRPVCVTEPQGGIRLWPFRMGAIPR